MSFQRKAFILEDSSVHMVSKLNLPYFVMKFLTVLQVFCFV